MNHLMRELAPVNDAAWTQIDDEATRSITHFLAARRLVDFAGPLGWQVSAVATGRTEPVDVTPLGSVEAVRRRVLALIELRAPFTLARGELDTVERGGSDPDLRPVIDAGRAAALAEDHLVFHGDPAAGISGIIAASPHEAVPIGDDFSAYPERVAKAVTVLRSADIAGPYAIALGTDCFTGVTETIERGGYPVLEHLRQLLGGPVVWAPAIQGAVVLSQRGGDYTLTVGQDFSIGFRHATGDSVALFIEESVAFQVNTPEAAVHLAYS
ncbi:MAG: family 1 encapsulin nanocompartment shell protein [Acidimicrobiales bacterium]|jgi:uncharacterized linocin/CFP29 family protein